MDISGLMGNFGNLVSNIFSAQPGVNFSGIVGSSDLRPGPVTIPARSTVPPAGFSSFLDTALNNITKIAGTGIGLYKVATGAKDIPQYIAGTPQVLNLTTSNPGIQPPNASTVQVYPASNTISVTSPAQTQGAQTPTNNNMMWLVIALLAIVALAIMKGK